MMMEVPINSGSIKITSYYGDRQYYYQSKLIKDFHNGIDLVPSPCNNNEILAFADGVVTSLQKTGTQYGKMCYVRIKHNNGLYTVYMHLKNNSICVNVGDKVRKGQKIGVIGTTGQSTGIHLHFQIDKGSSNTSINPYDYLFKNKIFIDNLSNYSDEELVKMVWLGKFGNGEERKLKLGNRYDQVQKIINNNVDKLKNIDKIVEEVIAGKWGNYPERKIKLENAGYNYNEVQKRVNEKMR